MNPNGLSTGVGRVKDATIVVTRGGYDAVSAANTEKNQETQEEDITRLIDHFTLLRRVTSDIYDIKVKIRSSEQKRRSLEYN
jgi:hypothetical protein